MPVESIFGFLDKFDVNGDEMEKLLEGRTLYFNHPVYSRNITSLFIFVCTKYKTFGEICEQCEICWNCPIFKVRKNIFSTIKTGTEEIKPFKSVKLDAKK